MHTILRSVDMGSLPGVWVGVRFAFSVYDLLYGVYFLLLCVYLYYIQPYISYFIFLSLLALDNVLVHFAVWFRFGSLTLPLRS